MADFFPEGNTPLPGDDEARLAKKWNSQLFTTYGNIGSTPFPEGSQPLASDDLERSMQKINAILKAT